MTDLMSSLGIVVFLLIGPVLGFGAGYVLHQQRAARDLARLRWLLRWSANMIRQFMQLCPEQEVDVYFIAQARDLISRIEEANDADD